MSLPDNMVIDNTNNLIALFQMALNVFSLDSLMIYIIISRSVASIFTHNELSLIEIIHLLTDKKLYINKIINMMNCFDISNEIFFISD